MIPAYYTLRARIGTFFGQRVWEDITGYWDSEAGSIEVTRGAAGESSDQSPGRLIVPLINDDGRFTAGRTTGPYGANVTDGAEVVLTALVPAVDQLEHDASYELGVSTWEGGGSSAPLVTQSTTHVYPDGGAWAVLLTWPVTAGDSAAQRLLYAFTPGAQYTVSRRVWVPAGSPDVRLRVNGGFVGTGALVAVKDGWALATVTFTASSTTHYVDVYAAACPSGGQCWVDAGKSQTGGTATVAGPPAVLIEEFSGRAAEWPTGGWAGPADTSATELVALGVFDRISRRKIRSFTIEEALLDAPTTLLPLDEPADATQAGNLGSDPRPAALLNQGAGGTAEFGAADGPPSDGSSSLVLTRASALVGWYLRVPCPVFADGITLEAFVLTSTGDASVINAAVPFVGDPAPGYGMQLRVNSIGRLDWRSNGTFTVTSPASVADGATHHVAATYAYTAPTTLTARLYVDGEQVASGTVGAAAGVVRCNWLLIGGAPKLGMWNGPINHVAAYPTALPADRIRAHALAGLTGFGGERSDQRISRLATYADLASLTPAARPGTWVLNDASASVLGSTTVLAGTDLQLATGSAQVWGQADGGFTVPEGMAEVAATEGGTVGEDRSGRLEFQSRTARYNRAPTARVDLAGGDVQPDLDVAYDTSTTVNDCTVTTQDGASFRHVDQASVDLRGPYEETLQLLTRDGNDALSAASWRVTRDSAPRPRYRTVTVDLTAMGADEALPVLLVDVGHRVDLTGLPAQAPAPAAELFVEGYTRRISDDELTTSWNTSAAEGYRVWVLDNPELSVLDSTTMLAW